MRHDLNINGRLDGKKKKKKKLALRFSCCLTFLKVCTEHNHYTLIMDEQISWEAGSDPPEMIFFFFWQLSLMPFTTCKMERRERQGARARREAKTRCADNLLPLNLQQHLGCLISKGSGGQIAFVCKEGGGGKNNWLLDVCVVIKMMINESEQAVVSVARESSHICHIWVVKLKKKTHTHTC